MKRYSILPIFLELEPHHQIHFSVIVTFSLSSTILFFVYFSQCIVLEAKKEKSTMKLFNVTNTFQAF